MTPALTSAEVAALTGIDEARVRKEVEHGLFGKTSPPRFDEPALVYFRALKLIDFELSTTDRAKLLSIINDKVVVRRKPPEVVKLGRALDLQLGGIVRELRKLLRDFSDWKARLTTDEAILGGESVFPGTRVSVRHVGTFLERVGGREEVREDYPKLTKRDFEYARLFAKAYPRRGRPRERREARP